MRSLLLLTLLVGCTASDPEDNSQFQTSEPPTDVTGAMYYGDLAYDSFDRTRVDLFVPEGEGPFPVFAWIHGGGFVGGEKEALYENGADYIQGFIDSGAAFANIEYRLLDAGGGGFLCMQDSMHGLQFLRLHSDELKLDPTNIAAGGVSAGAGTATWLATHDDMADPSAEDPLLQQSTRVVAASARETQATYDLVRWIDDVFSEYGITLDLAVLLGVDQTLLDFYVMESIDELEEEPVLSLRADMDMMGLASADDPPLWLQNQYTNATVPTTVDVIYHHPNHALYLRDAARAAGVEVMADIPILDESDEDLQSETEWILTQLGL